jgi:hypothetical protein
MWHAYPSLQALEKYRTIFEKFSKGDGAISLQALHAILTQSGAWSGENRKQTFLNP